MDFRPKQFSTLGVLIFLSQYGLNDDITLRASRRIDEVLNVLLYDAKTCEVIFNHFLNFVSQSFIKLN